VPLPASMQGPQGSGVSNQPRERINRSPPPVLGAHRRAGPSVAAWAPERRVSRRPTESEREPAGRPLGRSTPHGYTHHRWLRAPPAKSPTRASSFRRARGLTAGGRRVRGVRAMGASRGGEEVASWPRRRARASQSASALAMISPISPPASSAAAVALHHPSARHRIWPSQVQESHIQ
jgi:hypothetical protein